MKRLEINKGDKYNRLTIIKEVDSHIDLKSRKKSRKFQCKCECGNIKNIILLSLRNGKTKSCGCLDMETKTKHGMCGTKIYGVWKSMKERCDNSKHKEYHRYGGRGITYNPKWIIFENFYKDMGKSYERGLTLDRRKNNGNYCKSNCRWVTMKIQGRNRSNNRIYKGKCISEWIEDVGIPTRTVYGRLQKGFSIKEALSYKK